MAANDQLNRCFVIILNAIQAFSTVCMGISFMSSASSWSLLRSDENQSKLSLGAMPWAFDNSPAPDPDPALSRDRTR